MNASLYNANHIIWLVPERLGDALMGTAALALLKQHRPDLRVHLAAFSATSYDVYRHNPLIDDAVCCPTARVCRELSRQCDLVLHTHPEVDHAAAARFDLPLLAPVTMNINHHQAREQLDFIGGLLGLQDIPELCYTLNVSDADRACVARLLPATGDEWLVGCSIGCNRMARRGLRFWKPLTHPKVWPVEHIMALESGLRAQNMRLVLIGAGSEKHLARHFVRRHPYAINMTGNTNVPQLAALVDRMALIISSDTGLLHVACARQRPLIALHGPTDSARSGPFPLTSQCRIIKRETMQQISPEEVLEACRAVRSGKA
jgi:ADP-heptose:LPS heptosyltransferase